MLVESHGGSDAHCGAQERIQNVVPSVLLKELLSPVSLKALGLNVDLCNGRVLSRLKFALFLLIDAGLLVGDPRSVVRGDLLFLDEDDTLVGITSAACLHDGHNNLLLVDLLVEALVFKDLGPVDANILLGLAQA